MKKIDDLQIKQTLRLAKFTISLAVVFSGPFA